MQSADKEKLSAALSQMLRCPDSGAELLARRWQQAPADSASLAVVVRYSALVRDSRVLDAVLAVVSDRAQPIVVRTSALRVAYALATGGYLPTFPPDGSGALEWDELYVGSQQTTGKNALALDTFSFVASSLRLTAGRQGENANFSKLLLMAAMTIERRKGG